MHEVETSGIAVYVGYLYGVVITVYKMKCKDTLRRAIKIRKGGRYKKVLDYKCYCIIL